MSISELIKSCIVVTLHHSPPPAQDLKSGDCGASVEGEKIHVSLMFFFSLNPACRSLKNLCIVINDIIVM